MKRLALVALVACHPAAPQPVTLSRQPLPVNAGTIIELGDAVYIFDHRSVSIVRAGVVAVAANNIVPADWRSASTIAAPDGNGRWAVGVTADGSLWHVTASGEVEPIADRLGAGSQTLRQIAGAALTTVAATADTLDVTSDSVHMSRYSGVAPLDVAVARGRIAIANETAVEVWDLVHGRARTYPIAHARLGFLDADREHSRLVVARDELLYVEAGDELRRVPSPQIIDLATSGARLWVLGATRLYYLDGDTLVPTTVIVASGHLFGSPSGDVWYAATAGAAARYSIDRPIDPGWQANVAPVFERVCSHCHVPGGSAGIDLSTPGVWNAKLETIVDRVMVTRTMPPAGTDLTDTDRHMLGEWLDRKR